MLFLGYIYIHERCSPATQALPMWQNEPNRLKQNTPRYPAEDHLFLPPRSAVLLLSLYQVFFNVQRVSQ